MIGFDFDGVVSAGMRPGETDVIITGRVVEEARVTLEQLYRRGIIVPVFFNSCQFKEKSDLESASHKAKIIQLLGIKKFYEDSPEQAKLIAEFARGVEVMLVREGKATGEIIQK